MMNDKVDKKQQQYIKKKLKQNKTNSQLLTNCFIYLAGFFCFFGGVIFLFCPTEL